MMQCESCNTPLPYSYYAELMYRKGVNIPVRCVRCGRPHVRGEAISPETVPITVPGRLSPWHMHYYRPWQIGTYECRFRSTEPNTLFLWWNGTRFTHGGQNVSMLDFMGWRGTWR